MTQIPAPENDGSVPADLLHRITKAEAELESGATARRYSLVDFDKFNILAVKTIKWAANIRDFYRTKNNIFLFAAVSAWPDGEPIHSDVLTRIQRILGKIASIAESVVHIDTHVAVEDANAAILRALGVVKGGGKGSNALAMLRDDALQLTLIEARKELLAAEPKFLEKQVVGQLAATFNLSEANVRRILPARKRS